MSVPQQLAVRLLFATMALPVLLALSGCSRHDPSGSARRADAVTDAPSDALHEQLTDAIDLIAADNWPAAAWRLAALDGVCRARYPGEEADDICWAAADLGCHLRGRMGEGRTAFNCYAALMARWPSWEGQPDDRLIGIAQNSLVRGHLGKARWAVDALLADEPKHVHGLLLSAMIDQLQGDIAASLEAANQAVAIDPHNGFCYRQRAWAWLALGKEERAIEDLRAALKYAWQAETAAWLQVLTGELHLRPELFAGKDDDFVWQRAWARFGAGEMTAQELIRAAEAMPYVHERQRRRAAVGALLGYWAERRGRLGEARDHYQRAHLVPLTTLSVWWARRRLGAIEPRPLPR